MFEYAKLRGRIKEVLRNEKEYANKMELTPQAVSSKLNGNSYFTDKEIYKSCTILDIPMVEVPIYFFTLKTELNSTNNN